MNVQEFQDKLKALITLAKENKNTLTPQQIQEMLSGVELDQKQLMGVLKYLTAQSIRIDGIDGLEAAPAAETKIDAGEKKEVPLTPEEKAYLKDYLESLPEELTAAESAELFELLEKGKDEAQSRLSAGYLRKTAELAARMHTEEVLLADLIQEANLSLLQALKAGKGRKCDEQWLLEEVQKGIRLTLAEQDRRKSEDDSLVARVERLDKAVRELSDDEEEGGSAFSVNELAIILDMDEEEIRSTLRLTGDDA